MSTKKKVKARKMWQQPCGRDVTRNHLPIYCGNGRTPQWRKPKPVYVLPADAESFDAMHAQFWNRCLREYDAGRSMAQAVTAGFKEIGLVRPASPGSEGKV